jgi:SAM-dependent methyltransferase|tara:strand:+ start:2093 stop:2950 length:858 start_codon:yes stop_codon:yes gene_type:complete
MDKGKIHLKNIERHFSENADNWLQRYTDDEERAQVGHVVLSDRKNYAVKFLCKYLNTGSIVLDVGCGTGVVSIDLIRKDYFVHALDISESMIALLKKFFRSNIIPETSYSTQVGDIMNLPIDSIQFDGILALGFLEYQEDELLILNHLNKCLKKGGYLIITGPSKYKLTNFFGLNILAARFGRQALKKRIKRIFQNENYKINNQNQTAAPISINRYSISRFKKLLERCSFSLVDHKQHGYSGFYLLNNLITQKNQLKLHTLLSRISNYLPISRFANDIIVVAIKK